MHRSHKLGNDNQGAKFLTTNSMASSRTKHIDIRHHFVRDAFSEKLIDIEFVPTE